MSDLDFEQDLSAIRTFFKEHTAYELVPESGKVVVVDVGLTITQAFLILQQNGITSAPLWDTLRLDFVGMLTVSDFIDMFIGYDLIAKDISLTEWLNTTTIREWRKMKKQKQKEIRENAAKSSTLTLPPETPANISIGLSSFCNTIAYRLFFLKRVRHLWYLIMMHHSLIQ